NSHVIWTNHWHHQWIGWSWWRIFNYSIFNHFHARTYQKCYRYLYRNYCNQFTFWIYCRTSQSNRSPPLGNLTRVLSNCCNWLINRSKSEPPDSSGKTAQRIWILRLVNRNHHPIDRTAPKVSILVVKLNR